MTVPLNPDGTPDLNALGDPNSQPAGQLTIWNLILPKDLQNIGNEIWYGSTTEGSTNTPVPAHSIKILRMPGEAQNTNNGLGSIIETAGNADVLGGASTLAGQDTANQQTINVKAGTANTQTTHDIFTSPQAILAQIASLSDPRNLGNLQQFLGIQKALASGPWGSVNVNGIFDKSTQDAVINAMKDWYLISHGGKLGISFMDYLMGSGQVAQALGGGGTSAGSGLASSASATKTLDPSVIRMAAQTAAQSALGEGLSEKQLDQFVSQFQAQTAGQDTYTSSLHLPDIAMGFVQKNDPGAFKAQQQQSYLDTLVNMFAPSGSQRPNETPVPSIT